LQKNTAGFGPYVVESVSPGGEIVKLRARDDYWGRQPISQVIPQNVADPGSRLRLLLSGNVDHAEDISPLQLDTALKKGRSVQHFTSTTRSFPRHHQKTAWDGP